KGAYWDSEVKRAQVDGLAGYPVFTRKPNTDVSYLANAARLLSNTDAIYPMFATHNAQTIAAVHRMAGALLSSSAASLPSPVHGGRVGDGGSSGRDAADAPPSAPAGHLPPQAGEGKSKKQFPFEFQKLHGM